MANASPLTNIYRIDEEQEQHDKPYENDEDLNTLTVITSESKPSRTFALFTQYNVVEKEQYLYFCQWEGNEKELATLHIVSSYLHDDDLMINSHYRGVLFSGNILTTFKEEVVDSMLLIDARSTFNAHHPLITKCTGKFNIPKPLTREILCWIPNEERSQYLLSEFTRLFWPNKFGFYWFKSQCNKIQDSPEFSKIPDFIGELRHSCPVSISIDSVQLGRHKFTRELLKTSRKVLAFKNILTAVGSVIPDTELLLINAWIDSLELDSDVERSDTTGTFVETSHSTPITFS